MFGLDQSTRRVAARIAPVLVGLFLLAGCSEDPFAPYEPEISNDPDSFALQATGVQGVSLTRDYTWRNSGMNADVNQATTLTRGRATLTILDAEGNRVYLEDLTNNGTSHSADGTSGDWTIRIVLMDFSGTVNFRVQAP